MGDRKKATEVLLKYIDKILPGGENKAIYEEALAKLTNKQFESYMHKLRNGEEILFLIAPNLNKNRLSAERNIKIAKELGHNFFERLKLTDPETGVTYLTPIEYLVVDLPLRRQAQLLSKKVSIPKDNSRVDELTGQSAADRVGGLSFPELQTLHAHGLNKTIEELIKFRGGDEEAFREMNTRILRQGNVRLENIPSNSRVKGTETLSAIFKAMHLDNNL